MMVPARLGGRSAGLDVNVQQGYSISGLLG